MFAQVVISWETLEGRTGIAGIFDDGGLHPVLKQGSDVTAQHALQDKVPLRGAGTRKNETCPHY